MHPRVISNALGAVIAAGGAAMLIPAVFSLLAGDGNVLAFGVPALAAIALGATYFSLTRSREPRILSQDVFLMVVSGW